MAIDVDSIQDFTTAQLLKLVQYAIATLMTGGQSYTINGRQFTRADLDELRRMRTDLKAEVDAEEANEGSVALVRFHKQ